MRLELGQCKSSTSTRRRISRDGTTNETPKLPADTRIWVWQGHLTSPLSNEDFDLLVSNFMVTNSHTHNVCAHTIRVHVRCVCTYDACAYTMHVCIPSVNLRAATVNAHTWWCIHTAIDDCTQEIHNLDAKNVTVSNEEEDRESEEFLRLIFLS